MKLSQELAPLEPLKKKINVINGLFNKPATGLGIHPAQTGSLLSGAPIQKGADHQGRHHRRPVLANRVGQDTAAAQHRAGVRAADDRLPRDQFLDGVQLAHLVADADSPVPNEVYPSLAFDNLFENRGSLRNMSILDRVRDERAALTPPDQLRPTSRSWTNI